MRTPLSASFTRQEVTAAILETQRAITTRAGIDTLVAPHFGANRVHEDCCKRVLAGALRVEDRYIVNRLAEALVMHRGAGPLRILELGAGRSFAMLGTSGDPYGAPFLSRAIALTLGSRVEVTVSDAEGPGNGSVVWVTRGQELCVAPFEPDENRPSEVSAAQSRIPGHQIRNSIYSIVRGGIEGEVEGVDTALLTPRLDGEFESKVFGISRVVPRLAYGSGSSTTSQAAVYDFVFARHQYASEVEEIDRNILDSIASFAAPGAEIVAGFDIKGGGFVAARQCHLFHFRKGAWNKADPD